MSFMSVGYGNPSEIKKKFDDEKGVIKQLEEIRDNLEPEVKAELEGVMQKVLQAAISLCPKDTGLLAGSINLESGNVQAGDFYGSSIYAGDDTVNWKTGKTTAEYALYVHDGHEGYEGVPFLVEALMMYEAEVENAVSRALASMGQDIRSE